MFFVLKDGTFRQKNQAKKRILRIEEALWLKEQNRKSVARVERKIKTLSVGVTD
tara:strand:+ start:12475 stop:12636 length:162 start_codon:yes stop_codon:yes gene_type:complete